MTIKIIPALLAFSVFVRTVVASLLLPFQLLASVATYLVERMNSGRLCTREAHTAYSVGGVG